MKLHERESVVREASNALGKAIFEWAREYSEKLTFAEEISVVQSELGSCILRLTKYAIRYERHGDTDKPGGIA